MTVILVSGKLQAWEEASVFSQLVAPMRQCECFSLDGEKMAQYHSYCEGAWNFSEQSLLLWLKYNLLLYFPGSCMCVCLCV